MNIIPRDKGSKNAALEIPRQTPEFSSPTDDDAPASLLAEYYRTIMRYRGVVFGLAALGLLLSVVLHLTTQPVYRTRTSLDIQSLNGEFMNMRSLDPTTVASSGESNIQTEIKLLESDSLMEQVKERLTIEAHPTSVERKDLWSGFKRLLHLGRQDQISYQDLLNETVQGVKVKPLGITRLIEVTCESWDPAFAARFCNVLTSEFQAQDLESRGSQAKRTSDWLTHQAADIREKAEESQKRLMEATGGNGLVLTQESNTVGADRLRQMQGELVKAQADRMEKEAQNVVAHSASPDAIPGVVNSPAYAAQSAKLADLQNQVAALVPPLTEANPKVIHLRSEMKQVEQNLQQERQTSTQRMQNEYAAAKHREDLLAMAYRTQETSVSSDLEKGSQVALLRREVESEQQLYQTLLQRAKEAGFAAATQASTIRIIDSAQKPRFPIYPRRLKGAIVGTFAGLLLGLGYAFFKDRSATVLWLPGDTQRLLNLDELGVIPSAESVRILQPATKTSVANGLQVTSNAHPALQTVRWGEGFSIVADAYRSATLSLLHHRLPRQARAYVVSSPSAGDGKTTVASNLAVALSKSKLRVVLVDADLRKPSLHRVLSLPNDTGLRNVLRGEFDLENSPLEKFCRPTMFPRLSVISAGTGQEEVVELLHSPHLGQLVERLRQEFDVVLLDTPPMLHMADARILARHAHGTILIFRAGVTTREDAIAARNLFKRDHVRVVGSILNDFNPKRQGNYDYYSSYYSYQQDEQAASASGVMNTPALLAEPAVWTADAVIPPAPLLNEDLPRDVASQVIGGTSALGVAVVLERGAGFIANVLAARFAGAPAFGAYSLAISTANNISTYAAGGIGATAARFSGKYRFGNPEYAALARVLAIVSLSSALIAAAFLWGGAGPIARLLHKAALTGLLRWAALSSAGIIVLECARGFFVGQRRIAALLLLSVIVALGMVCLLPVMAATHRATNMIVAQGATSLIAVAACCALGRPLGLFAGGGAGLAIPIWPMLREVLGFGFIQLAGLVGSNLAGWWLTALIARADTSLVQMSFFAIASQLRNLTGLVPGLLTEGSYAAMAHPDEELLGTPHRVMAICTFGSTCAAMTLASVGIILVPWGLHLLYGTKYISAADTVALGMALAVVHMGNAPAAARLTIVSIRSTGIINTVWAVFVAGFGTLVLLHGGTAAQAMAVFFAAHVLSAAFVLVVLGSKDCIPAGLIQLFALSTFTEVVLVWLAHRRIVSRSLLVSVLMFAVLFLSQALLFLLGSKRGWLPSKTSMLKLVREQGARFSILQLRARKEPSDA